MRHNILRTLYVYLQPLTRSLISQQSNRIRWKKRKIRAIRRSRSFKVIEVDTNRKPVCDILLVINSNWHPTSYHFGVIAAYCSNFGHFPFLSTWHLWGTLSTFEGPWAPLRDLEHLWGTTYDVHLVLIGKRVMDFLLVLIELFSLGVTADALRAKIDRKSAISLERGQLDPKFQQSYLQGYWDS